MANLIDGKAISKAVREEIAAEVSALKEKGKTPGLAVVIVGEDSASQVYVKNKVKGCAEVGMYSEKYELAADVPESELLALIDELNAKPEIDGILVQLPLPKHIDETKVIEAINPDKDVDAFHPINTGKLFEGKPTFLPCTPAGVMELLSRSGVDVTGKECVIIGRSNIVGKPQFHLLLMANGTVTVCHSKTKDLAAVARRADILVVAIGRAKFVTGDMVKDGAVVIDVGMNRDEDGKLCGDVDFDSVAPKSSLITPVPGGVGPMTITMLLQNTMRSAKAELERR